MLQKKLLPSSSSFLTPEIIPYSLVPLCSLAIINESSSEIISKQDTSWFFLIIWNILASAIQIKEKYKQKLPNEQTEWKKQPSKWKKTRRLLGKKPKRCGGRCNLVQEKKMQNSASRSLAARFCMHLYS